MTFVLARNDADCGRVPIGFAANWLPAEIHRGVGFGSKGDMRIFLADVRFARDSVAKVVLHRWSKILRAAGAVFV